MFSASNVSECNVIEDQVIQSITVDEVDVVNDVIQMHNPSISCHFIFLLPIKNIYIDLFI